MPNAPFSQSLSHILVITIIMAQSKNLTSVQQFHFHSSISWQSFLQYDISGVNVNFSELHIIISHFLVLCSLFLLINKLTHKNLFTLYILKSYSLYFV